MTQRTIKICSFDECSNRQVGRGLCDGHYQQARKGQDLRPLTVRRRKNQTYDEFFWSQVDMTGDCWIWQHSISDSGYGRFTNDKGVRVRAHRYSYEAINGPIPDGMLLDHECHNRLCVNPSHLRPADYSQNGSNRAEPPQHTKSGVRNVTKNKKRWSVVITKNRVRHRFGTYDTIEEAAVVAEQARKDLFGEFAGRG